MLERDRTLQVLRDTVGRLPDVASAVEKATSAEGRWTPEYWETLSDVLGVNAVDRPLTLNEAMRLAAFVVCVDVISQDISKVRMILKRRVKNGAEEVLPKEHWVARLLATEPNSHHTWVEFFEMVLIHLSTLRTAFIVKRGVNRQGEAAELVPVIPGRVQIDVNSDRSDFVYRIFATTEHEAVLLGGTSFTLRSDQMIHLRGRMFDGLNGFSTLAAGAKALGLSQEVVDYETRLFRSDAQTRGVFEMREGSDQEGLSEQAFIRLKQQLAEGMHNLRRIGKPLVLEGGLTFKGISMTADQAEVEAAWKAAVIDTCRLFRMPPHKAMHLDAVKYENLEAMERSYVSDTLIPYCIRIEQRFARTLLTEDERLDYSLEFDREALLLSDPEKLAAVMKVGLGHGALMLNEYRRRVGLNALPGKAGDVRLVPSTFNVVDNAGKVVIAAGGKQPGQAEAPDESEGDQKPPGKGANPHLRVVGEEN
ncbi:MAG: phage portal protein [Bauldia sp.]|nr:phage portal protein [Bauldia sp.]